MNYRDHVFDCDGVLIDSNGVKSRAFYEAALPYGEEAANALVSYHQAAGSIGRAARWRYFFSNILKRQPEDGELDAAMAQCTNLIREGTLAAALLSGTVDYLDSLGWQNCVVVSGIEETELKELLDAHGLLLKFRRIWGGPRTKPVLLRDVICSRLIELPALYYGDTEDDYLSARGAGLDFLWVNGCSEWSGMRAVRDFKELLSA